MIYEPGDLVLVLDSLRPFRVKRRFNTLNLTQTMFVADEMGRTHYVHASQVRRGAMSFGGTVILNA